MDRDILTMLERMETYLKRIRKGLESPDWRNVPADIAELSEITRRLTNKVIKEYSTRQIYPNE